MWIKSQNAPLCVEKTCSLVFKAKQVSDKYFHFAHNKELKPKPILHLTAAFISLEERTWKLYKKNKKIKNITYNSNMCNL